MYNAAAEIRLKIVTTQLAILLNCAGEAARDICDCLGLALDGDVVLATCRDYCNPRRKRTFESYKFWQRH